MAGFIVDEEDEEAGAVPGAAAAARKAARQKRRTAAAALGVSTAALQEAQDIFGDVDDLLEQYAAQKAARKAAGGPGGGGAAAAEGEEGALGEEEEEEEDDSEEEEEQQPGNRPAPACPPCYCLATNHTNLCALACESSGTLRLRLGHRNADARSSFPVSRRPPPRTPHLPAAEGEDAEAAEARRAARRERREARAARAAAARSRALAKALAILDPDLVAAHHLRPEDEAIRERDVPERLQLLGDRALQPAAAAGEEVEATSPSGYRAAADWLFDALFADPQGPPLVQELFRRGVVEVDGNPLLGGGGGGDDAASSFWGRDQLKGVAEETLDLRGRRGLREAARATQGYIK